MNNPVTINVKKLVPEASIPQNATTLDTGYDLIALEDGKIVGDAINEKVNYWKRIDYIEYKTGLTIAPQDIYQYRDHLGGNYPTREVLWTEQCFTLLFPRSSISKYNLSLCNSVGVIDNSFRGEILLRFNYLWQPEDYVVEKSGGEFSLFGSPNLSKIYKKGDKIGQLAAFKLNAIQFKEVDDLNKTERGTGGFGSSGQ